MIIRCWGARGSIPVSGQEYLKYGGDTTCIEIRTKDNDVVIVDAGSGIRRLGNRLIQEDIYECGIIFTHAHWDHLMGFPFFKPLYFTKTKIHVCGCPFSHTTPREMIERVMSPPNFPVRYADLRASIDYTGDCEGTFTIGSLTVTPIALSHPNQGNGYKFVEDGKVFVFLTDNELTFTHPGGLEYDDYRKFCEGSDLLFHDAEYTRLDYARRKEWGHSVYNDALDLAHEAKVKTLGLFHHNQERTDGEIDEIVKDCEHIIKERRSTMGCIAVNQETEIRL
jgi:phosphoribosyl 1,2-cyclic phosphodiesterase